jgi:Cu+-exporting ATPase
MGIAVLSFVIWMIAGAEFEFALSIGIAVLVISCLVP